MEDLEKELKKYEDVCYTLTETRQLLTISEDNLKKAQVEIAN